LVKEVVSVSVGDAKAALAHAYASGKTPRLLSVAPNGLDELWALADVVFVVPVVPADAPPLLEYALRLRREAMLTGACDQCGASFTVMVIDETETPKVGTSFFAHRSNCPGRDENVLPLLEKYHKKHFTSSVSVEIDLAKRKTKERLLASLTNRIDINVTGEIKSQANRFLDERLSTSPVKACGHLTSKPIQTWNLFLWNDMWRCDECLLRFSESVRHGAFRLTALEDYSCDFCRRYAPKTLSPVVMRVDTFVMHGGICRRCAREWGYVEEETRT
jgi:hypothetical protein